MVKDWHEIDEPWFIIDDFDSVISDLLSIIDILEMFEIEYSYCRTGEFTHKLRCPFHADGEERTPSCYVSQDTNSFYCFGCNSSGNLIDFYAKYIPCPYFKAMEELSAIVGITAGSDIQNLTDNLPKREKRDPEKTIAFYVFKTGNLVRDYLSKIKNSNEYNKRLLWADKKIFPKLDLLLDKATDDDWEKAKDFFDKVKFIVGKE